MSGASSTGFYLYILRCGDGSYYTDHTEEPERRLAAHQSGAILGYTYARRPVELVYLQEFASRDEAFQRERQVKGWSRSKKEALIAGDWTSLRELARTHGSTSSP